MIPANMIPLAVGMLDEAHLTLLLLSLALMLGTARVLGELARRLRLPMVIGEILAGILLGPTLLGAVMPETFAWLFPATGPAAAGLEFFIVLAVTLLLLVAGLEVDLSVVWRQGKAALMVSLTGLVFPFVIGAGLAWLLPGMLGKSHDAPALPFALFVGVAMAITALPVIAKILMDLNMLKSDIGMLIMSAAMVDDLVGWMGFAVVLAMMTGHSGDLGGTLIGTLLFAGGMLTVGRFLIHRALPFVQAHTSWPGGVLGFVLVLTLTGAACTEWLGVHAIFGAFITGVAIGDSKHLREQTRQIIHQFITNIFAPVFFASVGLRLNFLDAFNPVLVIVVLVIAVAVKVGGCYLGATLAGMKRNESLAVGFGMSARGAMEIVLGQLARQAGLINDELFVAIVVMALVTSLMSGPLMQRLLKRGPQRHLRDLMSDRQFIPALTCRTAREVIDALAVPASKISGIPADKIANVVWEREQLVSTGLGNGLAVPHGRFDELTRPVIIIGRDFEGIDFNAPDGRPANIICMLLTPKDDPTSQIELLSMVAHAFVDERTRERVLEAANYTQFLAVLNQAAASTIEHA